MKTQVFAAVAALGIGFSSSAHAVFADFTDSSQFANGDFTQVIGGVTVTISATGGTLNFNEIPVGNGMEPFCAAQSGRYACDHDGAGVNNDEITEGGQSIIIDFSEVVLITDMGFLDLFFEAELDAQEAALVDYNGGGFDEIFPASEGFSVDAAGFESVQPGMGPIATNRLVFTAGGSGDGQGVPGLTSDYALGSIDFERVQTEIPVPAALPLLLTAFAGLGFVGWRRRSAV